MAMIFLPALLLVALYSIRNRALEYSLPILQATAVTQDNMHHLWPAIPGRGSLFHSTGYTTYPLQPKAEVYGQALLFINTINTGTGCAVTAHSPDARAYARVTGLAPATKGHITSGSYRSAGSLAYSFSALSEVHPFWRRDWFVALLVVLLLASMMSVVRFREKSLVKLNLLLEQKVQHRTQLLEEKNREKETLLKEVHHRVKNNLQIVISLLNLQVRRTKNQDAIDVMRAIRNRVKAMALLHERLYMQNDLGQIDLNDYFTQICESLYSSFGITQEKIALQVAVPHIKIDIDSAITLGLIVNEIVSNALKYAFPDEQTGLLRIALESHDNRTYTLVIADNGTGLPPDIEQKQSLSFGLQLVNSLISKLNGKIELKNKNGTIAILTFILPS
ncbi:sensor histidine kinase [Botryobacter ruber]|uniref:sensor histidine kinase n=1 Tax=Botryobacter ruber TaxID=2171629 RepID=UPI0013E2DD3D|nr:sensor histidine kinase [Botryobacter ruber]